MPQTEDVRNRNRLVLRVGEELVDEFNAEAERRHVSLAELAKEVFLARYHPDRGYVAREKYTARSTATVRKNLTLPPDADARLEALAQHYHCSVSEVIAKMARGESVTLPTHAATGRKTPLRAVAAR